MERKTKKESKKACRGKDAHPWRPGTLLELGSAKFGSGKRLSYEWFSAAFHCANATREY